MFESFVKYVLEHCLGPENIIYQFGGHFPCRNDIWKIHLWEKITKNAIFRQFLVCSLARKGPQGAIEYST